MTTREFPFDLPQPVLPAVADAHYTLPGWNTIASVQMADITVPRPFVAVGWLRVQHSIAATEILVRVTGLGGELVIAQPYIFTAANVDVIIPLSLGGAFTGGLNVEVDPVAGDLWVKDARIEIVS